MAKYMYHPRPVKTTRSLVHYSLVHFCEANTFVSFVAKKLSHSFTTHPFTFVKQTLCGPLCFSVVNFFKTFVLFAFFVCLVVNNKKVR